MDASSVPRDRSPGFCYLIIYFLLRRNVDQKKKKILNKNKRLERQRQGVEENETFIFTKLFLSTLYRRRRH